MDRSDTLAADSADSADTALCDAWSRGDEDALARIVERHGALVHARCRRALPPSDADDAAQAVFLVLARRGSQAARSPVLAAWLLRVADNVVRNALRDQRRRRSAERAAAQRASGEDAAMPTMEPVDREIHERLAFALERLRPVEREAIQLHYLAGCSLAEVARASASGLSTVKERIGRGLERLRADLERAGCACALPAVAGGLPRIAPPLLPGQCARLIAILRRPPRDIPPHIRRWMRQGPSMTSILTSATAAILLVGGAALQCSIHAAERGAPDAPATGAAKPSSGTQGSAQGSAQAEDFYAQLDPDKARTWLSIRWTDGRRTAERLRSLPEVALLPDQGAAVLTEIASLRDASLWLCLDSLMSSESMKRQYRVMTNMVHMNLQQHLDSMTKLIAQQMKEARPGQSPYTTANMIFHFRAHAGAMDAPVVGWLRGLPQRAGSSDKPASPTSPLAAWFTLPAELHRTVTDATVCIDSADAQEVAMPASLQSDSGDDDVIACQQLDDGHGHRRLTCRADLQVRSTGLHLDVDAPLMPMPAATSAGPAEVASRDDLARVPGDALMACDMASSQAPTYTTTPWITILHVMHLIYEQGQVPNHPAPLAAFGPGFTHVLNALDRAEGHLLFYVQPGPAIPELTAEIDMPKQACIDLVKALGHPVAEDGSTHIPFRLGVATLGWQDGRLIFTTQPGGLEACAAQSGFTKEPEVAAALAAMPTGPCSYFAILRPGAFVSAIAPVLGMIAPQVASQVPAYQARLQVSQSYAYFAAVNTPQGVHEEASGLLAGVAGAFLYSQLKGPSGIN
jgi:RNA polymerase sigma factor (sigma-70 family)